MVTRIISALIAAIIFIPLLIIGGNVFDGAVIIVALLGLKEFIDIKCTKKEMPIFIKLMSYIIMTIILVFMFIAISVILAFGNQILNFIMSIEKIQMITKTIYNLFIHALKFVDYKKCFLFICINKEDKIIENKK